MAGKPMGVLFVGTGHQTMTYDLPRPCRYDDLTRASTSGHLPELALIADGTPQTLTDAVNAWRLVVPDTRIFLFHTPGFTDAVRLAVNAEPTIIARPVPTYMALHRHPEALACRAWASCAPYDAHGVLIKIDLESISYKALRHNSGIYLAHDPAFGIVRWFDATGIHDRIRYRGARLLLYRWACRIVHAFAWISSRFSTSEFKWRKA